MDKSPLFAAVVIVVIIVLVYALIYVACASGRQLVGFWSTPNGALFEISPQNGGHTATTASKYLGAVPGKGYPVHMRGCRSLKIELPQGVLRGKVGLDKRRILWDNAPLWHRQGV